MKVQFPYFGKAGSTIDEAAQRYIEGWKEWEENEKFKAMRGRLERLKRGEVRAKSQIKKLKSELAALKKANASQYEVSLQHCIDAVKLREELESVKREK